MLASHSVPYGLLEAGFYSSTGWGWWKGVCVRGQRHFGAQELGYCQKQTVARSVASVSLGALPPA